MNTHQDKTKSLDRMFNEHVNTNSIDVTEEAIAYIIANRDRLRYLASAYEWKSRQEQLFSHIRREFGDEICFNDIYKAIRKYICPSSNYVFVSMLIILLLITVPIIYTHDMGIYIIINIIGGVFMALVIYIVLNETYFRPYCLSKLYRKLNKPKQLLHKKL